MGIKKLKNLDLRTLKDDYFKGMDNDEILMDKTVLSILYEYTTPKGPGVSEKFIKSKYLSMQTNLLMEYGVREGNFEAKYTKDGKIKSVKMTEKGKKSAEKLVKKLSK